MYLGVKLDKWLLYTAQLYTLHIICSSSNSTTQSLSCHKEVQTILKPPANFSTCSQMGLKSFGWFTSCQAHIKAVRAGKCSFEAVGLTHFWAVQSHHSIPINESVLRVSVHIHTDQGMHRTRHSRTDERKSSALIVRMLCITYRHTLWSPCLCTWPSH